MLVFFFFFLLKNDIINLIKHLQRIEDTPTETERSIWLLISNKRSDQSSVFGETNRKKKMPCPCIYTSAFYNVSDLMFSQIFFVLFFYKRTNYLTFKKTENKVETKSFSIGLGCCVVVE